MSDKKIPTVEELQKEITKLKKKLSDTTWVLQESLKLEKQLQNVHDKEIQDLKTQIDLKVADYRRACDITRLLSNAVGRLTETRYE
jgi:predicted RNase H-like nuclease (RuvC/YqgF family)